MNKNSVYAVLIGILLTGGIFFLVWIFSPTKTKESPLSSVTNEITAATQNKLIELGEFHYIEVVEGCDSAYVGTCVNLRSGPGSEFSVVERLRTGIVLKVAQSVVIDGHMWYKILQDAHIRYPERVTTDWYVYADAVRLFSDEGDKVVPLGTVATSSKRIVVSLSSERLYAYEGDSLFMEEPISTGLEYTPTPAGTFSIYQKTPSRYMQGPLPGVSSQKYDLPGVPWNLYFTKGGAVIHGAYWHNHFGELWSHGCVNLAPQNAKKLYEWADIGTPVVVQY